MSQRYGKTSRIDGRLIFMMGFMMVFVCASLFLRAADAHQVDPLESSVARVQSLSDPAQGALGHETHGAKLRSSVATDPDPMAAQAIAFLDSLSDEQRAACTFEFADPERRHWQAAPMGDAGVRLDEMSEVQREAAHNLLKSALSAQGLSSVDDVMVLERILVKMAEARGQSGGLLAVDRYFITIYGDPKGDDVWGWRIEGHHLSMTFTCKNQAWTAHGPLFVGAQPARVVGGEHDGKRVLGSTDDHVRRLFLSLTDAQRTEAIVEGRLPRNVILLPGQDKGFEKPQGLAGSEMSADQRSALFVAITQWAKMLRVDLAEAEIERMKAGLDVTRVMWMGEVGVDEPHYWRITGPHFAIEYAAPQRDPDHVHALWRDTSNDFGGALLRRHLEEHHGEVKDP